MAVIIPILADTPSQRFSITLDEVAYFFVAKWNSRASFWSLDIEDENENTILSGISLQKGVDLLGAYNTTLTGPMTVQGQIPTLSNIGTDSVLVYGN